MGGPSWFTLFFRKLCFAKSRLWVIMHWCAPSALKGDLQMTYTYSVFYNPCQTCTAKIHCDDCDSGIVSALLARGDIESVSINIRRKELAVSTLMDEDDLIDRLEALGLFV